MLSPPVDLNQKIQYSDSFENISIGNVILSMLLDFLKL